MPDLDKRYLAALVVAALAVVAAVLILAKQPAKVDPQAAVQEKARLDIERMIQEDMAAAKAQAELNAMIRQAEMDAADNMLNSLTADTNLTQEPPPVEDLPPTEANEQAEEPPEPAQSNVLSPDIYRSRGKEPSN